MKLESTRGQLSGPIAPAPPEVLDQRMVDELRTFGHEPGQLLHEVLHDFLIEAPSLMADIERAVEEEAYDTAARAAHRLKGAGGHMGAARLSVVAGEVETLARTGMRQATASATATARTELDLAMAAARGLLPGTS
jgi:HPt (histidine-containing phosphotransfer) domain-containing protein